MTLTEMIFAIRQEIQETVASVWTDAELTRAVQKSVSLMSRFIPKRVIVETTIVIDVDGEAFTTPATASATAIVNAQTLNGVASGGTLTIADKTPDVPRRLTVTLTDGDASVTALTIIVKGYDKEGNYQEETWLLKDLPSGTAIQGSRYFSYVSEVEVDNVAGVKDVADTVSVGTGNAYDSYRYLANRAILFDSETVTSSPAGTTYVRDTGYRMDYANGGIKFINGGGMAAGTPYLISYDLDSSMLDISPLIPTRDYIKIEKVEYPVGDTPPTYPVFEHLGDILYIKGKGVALVAKSHLRLVYLKPWGAPGTLTKGDYPEHLDNAVIIGGVGQALIFKAEKYVQSAITCIAASKTLLDAIAAVTAPTSPTIIGAGSYLALAETALAAAIARFEAAVTEVDKMDTPLANAATAMGLVAARVAAGLAYLQAGDDKIILINDAERVAEKYAQYAEAEALLAQGYGQEAERDIALAQGWEARAAREMGTGNSYLAEAVQRLTEASRVTELFQAQVAKANQEVSYYNAQLIKAQQLQTTGNQYLDAAGRYLSSGQAKINEMLIMLGLKSEFHTYKGASEQFA